MKHERTSLTRSSDSNTSNLSTNSPNSNQTAGTEGNWNNSVALQTDSTAVNIKNCKKSILRMLFDSGSQITFLNENVKELLNLKSIRKEKLLINTFSENSSF